MDDGWYDCYVLVGSRSPELVNRFLDHFVPQRQETADEYEVPQHSAKPEMVFRTAAALLQYLSDHPEHHHAVYWHALGKGDPTRAMVFPTSDGATIVGLSCRSDAETAERLLAEMKSFLHTDIGSFWFETPAPTSSKEFIRRAKEEPAGAHLPHGGRVRGRPTSGCS